MGGDPFSRAEIEMKTPTVFVLGAGASASFGFPLGSGWFQEIRQELEDSSDQPLSFYMNNLATIMNF